jgi:hypothetical protein
MAGLIANRVLYEGQSLQSFKMEAAGFVSFFVLFILGPLLMFTPRLEHAQRKGSSEYGLLASRYVFGFEEKWVKVAPETSELLGTEDISGLADLGNAYFVVGEMRIVPFGIKDVTRLAAATAAPFLPLSLTVFSVPQVLEFLVKVLFK